SYELREEWKDSLLTAALCLVWTSHGCTCMRICSMHCMRSSRTHVSRLARAARELPHSSSIQTRSMCVRFDLPRSDHGNDPWTSQCAQERSMRLWIACFSLLLPTLGLACEYDRHTCEQDIVKLLSYRSEAIQGAFGDLSVAQPAQLQVKFVGTKDSQYPALRRSMRYDAQRKVLLVPLSMTSMTLPNPLRMAAYYWPFYAKDAARDAFPIIEAIDDALWTIFLE